MVSPARYDGLADWYETWSERPAVAGVSGEAAAAVIRLLGPGPGRCLDVGCGGGRLLVALHEAGWAPSGVDLSEDQLRVAAARAGDRAEALVAADATALPFADGSFDAVVSTFTHTDLDDPGRALRECARVLRDGGAFVYAGAHPCFVGPYAHRTDEGVVVPPGYWDERLRFDAPGFGDGVRRLAGARHVPLAALLNHVAAAGLFLERAEELRDDPPGILALRAARR
ncbi:MAG TPA: class I SAM-dependent methyltransferase [Gaiellales bacterium]|nr:class I SAM-dependent methyltransferase [Gaiellales bacterium]